MQKIATKVFIGASLVFGVCGIYMVLTGNEPGHSGNHGAVLVMSKILQMSIFVILSSFALSVAGKYLNTK